VGGGAQEAQAPRNLGSVVYIILRNFYRHDNTETAQSHSKLFQTSESQACRLLHPETLSRKLQNKNPNQSPLAPARDQDHRVEARHANPRTSQV
jgi:hypothetical protein